ncbi:gliding motility-associated ABC transporter permease subunit GldF [Gillisia sp. M10.2A]|uniref:Gliding motility-associated ABC transporter permease subunit GldF n=1 Tax=Gillisia lutea TaxID=2909668 RepID=A0ABS9EMM2_9FLAO|nr:gliding motility-associated ABC transporter permease subunit GldF [Gillisia lutea]MCF4102753.1 gliding motility-associated ABC transporter permease subunit GldF [Gillisia lutea]
MIAILKKEMYSFFSSPVGYLVIGIFLTISGLFLFVFNGAYNILDNGFADLSPFFNLAPWIFIFLIPAITMRSFSEEKRQGTMELLLTKPISTQHLVIGKFLGALLLSFIALLPSIIYIFTIYQLGAPTGNLDTGATMGSYIGLFLLAASYTAIGLFASSLSTNQITAFIISLFLCFLCFFAFEGLGNVQMLENSNYGMEYLGMSYHYKSISRGVVDTRDLIYFISLIGFFLSLTYLKIILPKNKA